MSGWLCREPLKATATVNYAQGRLVRSAVSEAGKEKFRLLTQYRNTLISKLSQYQHGAEETDEAFSQYLGFLLGLLKKMGVDVHVEAPIRKKAKEGEASAEGEGEGGDGMGKKTKPSVAEEIGWDDFDEAAKAVPKEHADRGESAALHSVTFKYHDNIANKVTEQLDFNYEVANMIMNYGLWHMKHASWLESFSAPEAERQDVAKAIFESLKTAAGVFKYLLDQHLRNLEYKPHTDFDQRMLAARYQQCLAEAQEGVLERARTLKHSPTLIASIAYDEFKRYEVCADDMSSMKDVASKHWHKYFVFKASFYKAYMFYYQSIGFIEAEEHGKGIKCLRDAMAELERSHSLANEYMKQKSFITARALPTTPANEHALFSFLAKEIKTSLEKAERENTLLYHQKVPQAAVPFPEPKCVVEEVPFSLPPPNEDWKTVTLKFEDVPEVGQDPVADKAAKDKEKVKENPFDPIKHKSNDVCIIS